MIVPIATFLLRAGSLFRRAAPVARAAASTSARNAKILKQADRFVIRNPKTLWKPWTWLNKTTRVRVPQPAARTVTRTSTRIRRPKGGRKSQLSKPKFNQQQIAQARAEAAQQAKKFAKQKRELANKYAAKVASKRKQLAKQARKEASKKEAILKENRGKALISSQAQITEARVASQKAKDLTILAQKSQAKAKNLATQAAKAEYRAKRIKKAHQVASKAAEANSSTIATTKAIVRPLAINTIAAGTLVAGVTFVE